MLRTQLTVAGGVAAFSVACEGDPTSTSLVADLAAAELVVSESGAVGQDQTLSPDGSRFVRQEGSWTGSAGLPIVGPLTIRDAATGAVLVELDGLCTWEANLVDDALDAQPGCSEIPTPPFRFWALELRWSADGTSVLGVTDEGGGGLMVWNATSGDLLRAESIDATSAIFTPDGSEVIAASGEDDGPHLVRYSIADGQIVENKAVGIGDSSFIGYSADGSILYLVDQGRTFEDGAMRAVAADDFDLLRSRERLNEGGYRQPP
ncbi:MAG: hypothetical protein ACR2K4_07335 [Candidatus Limnocylindria bacterium]